MNAPVEPKVTEHVVRMYEARQPIYPRETKGRYASLRWLCVWLTQLVFYGVPWLTWNDRQAVLFDLGTRKFYLFGLVLWPQDFIYLAALLIICAWGLFLVTAVAGRVWCGFACPQTVYTEIFLWIERKIEGSRAARIALDKQGPSLKKTAKKVTKHLVWGVFALWTGFTFVGYFTPIHELGTSAFTLSFGPWEWFWVLFYAFATYGNAGWLREQVCKYMCPYARFQSSMFDRDTLIITYDAKRGEPRSKKGTGGSCIDCTMCVQVCPTGIDIRKGLQYECIGCAACVDACNIVMDKINEPRGLIRYSTDHAMERGMNSAEIRKRALRPRVLAYIGALVAVIVAVSMTLATRTPLKVDVIRDRGSMGREVDGGAIENVYRLQVMNTSERGHRFRIVAQGLPGLKLATEDTVELAPTETRAVPVRVQAPHGAGSAGSNHIVFTLTAVDDKEITVSEKAVFIVPR
ncbi:cytochrome c oxidase accessory protein FixG [Pseudoduganella flava]|uniref:Cytochrome c oxidase accessory protein CcoG n=1 Tax=Pseudoduganella flava TaxID=871742 RepID=A0A562PGC4_9BURK|nr:cytochrome c oxidase accessory protein CcoG [Pseudoduganella flava]QGZ40343.1 cytochrome c oxidase accessory protein CcoG [Pseudoduganella flava]TWI43532.1 cytochrome c oxidase accessory protein FixG [Pseudoduganella flava]